MKLTGGPHGKNLKLEVDGEELRGVYHVDMAVDVNDVSGHVVLHGRHQRAGD
jgi:hypothetical protein